MLVEVGQHAIFGFDRRTIVQGDAKVIEIDYSKDDSIKQAPAGVHVVQVVISTIRPQAIDVQTKIAVAAKEVGVQLFCLSESGGISANEAEVIIPSKEAMRKKLKPIATIPT